jgi:16S rRNA (uracil1498-N3)-methyltransferase
VSAPRFFVATLEVEPGSIIRLSAQDSRHALRSLRLRRGDELSVADGRGRIASARLLTERAGGRSEEAQAEVLEVRSAIRPTPSVSVAMAPPKGDRLSWAVQKLGELGVDGLALLQSERSVRTLKSDRDRSERSVERLRNVAREAAMQSRQAFVMEIDGVCSLEDALGIRQLLRTELAKHLDRAPARHDEIESLGDGGDPEPREKGDARRATLTDE